MRNTFWSVLAVAVTVAYLAGPTLARADDTWIVDFEKAKKIATEKNLDILMEFTGSDWCPPCKRMKANVFTKDAFKDTAPKHFVLLKLDFPRDKSKQSAEEIKQNQQLNTKYGVTGYPTVLLVDAKGRPYAKKVGYGGQAAKAYMDSLLKSVGARKKRDTFFAKAKDATGIERAKLLSKAVAGIDAELVVSTYRETIDEIIKLDAKNEAKLKQKFEGLVKLTDVKKSLQKIQRAGARNPEASVKSVDALIKSEKLTGESLQEALYVKGALLFRNDKGASRMTLEAAIEAAPNSERAKQIRGIIKRAFK